MRVQGGASALTSGSAGVDGPERRIAFFKNHVRFVSSRVFKQRNCRSCRIVLKLVSQVNPGGRPAAVSHGDFITVTS